MPDPDAPATALTRPGARQWLSPCSTVRRARPWPHVRTTAWSSMVAGDHRSGARRGRAGAGPGAPAAAGLSSSPPSVIRTWARSPMPASPNIAGGSESQPLRPTTIPPPPGASPISSTMRPSRMRTPRCAAEAAAGSWETTIAVAPSVPASSAISRNTARPLTASSSPVGSSASRSAGRCAIAMHSAARWRSPPERAPGSAPARSSSPAASSSSSARRRRAPRAVPRSASGRATQSRSARSGDSEDPECCPSSPIDSWRMRARARAEARPISRPSTWTAPADGVCSPAMIRRRVLLPAPLGPSTQTLSPRLTVSVAPCRAAASPWLVRCTLKTSRNATTSVTSALLGRGPRCPARSRARGRPARRHPTGRARPPGRR